MFKQILLGLFLLAAWPCFSQQNADFNKIAPPADSRVKNFEDFLVQLAWKNNPQGYILQHQISMAADEVKITNMDWMDNISLSLNVNEVSLSNIVYDYSQTNESLFVPYPFWNFRASIDLGDIFVRPIRKRVAEQEVKIKEHEVNIKKLDVRSQTLQRYYAFATALKVLKSKTSAEEDAYETYVLIAEKFRENEATLEEITNSSRTYYNAQDSKIRAQGELKSTKVKLEEMIGISYEEAERQSGGLKPLDENKLPESKRE